MDKMKALSSISLGIVAVSLFSTTNLKKVKALSNSIYSFTNETYTIDYKDNVITLKLKNNNHHQNIQSIKLVDKNNKTYNFEKNSSDFKLYLKGKINDGLYNLVFTDKVSGSSSSRELSSPIYIDFPDIATQNVSVTSLNPIISVTNLNGVTKLNARFTVLNIQDKITNARIVDEKDLQIGTLENANNPRNYIFNLGSYSFSPDKVYYIEYWIQNSKNDISKIKIPFNYATNSIRITPVYSSGFTYTSTLNSDNNTTNLKLKFKNTDVSNISFYDADNLAFQFSPSYDTEGNIILNNIPVNSVIRVEIRNGKNTEFLDFNVPDVNISTETAIPFLKFINSSNITLKKGNTVILPIISEDLSNSGFNNTSSYIKLVYIDDFGNEIDLSNEGRISISNYQAELVINSNIDSIKNNSRIYVKVSNSSRDRLYPFSVSNTLTSAQPLAFDVIKNSLNSTHTSLTFRPNSSLLTSGSTFTSNDYLIINDEIKATLSNDGRSFEATIPNNKLLYGKNYYTFVKNYSNGNSLSYDGDFLINTTSEEKVNITPVVNSINNLVYNDKELILQVDLDDDFLQSKFHTSTKLTDDRGNTISAKSTVKTIGNNKVIELVISPPGQLIHGKPYNLSINTGNKQFVTSFIFNRDSSQSTNISLTFNSNSKFTIKNLSSVPGFAIYNFNVKIYDYYNTRDVIYENNDRLYYGESFNTDSITRTLKDGKTFRDNVRYAIEIKNTNTDDVYKHDFIFREDDVVSPDGTAPKLNINSSSLSFSNDGAGFKYSTSRSVRNVTCSNQDLTANYSNGMIYINELVPNKIYKDLVLTVNFSDNKTQEIRIGTFTSNSSSNNLKNYISKVYTTSLTPVNEKDKSKFRYADESGFKYWYNMLSNKKISGPEFIYRILEANEFNQIHKNAEDKIKALYPIVVNRDGDSVGLNYWINEYNRNLQSLNSSEIALKITLAKMLGEEEPKQLFLNLGIRAE